MILDSVEIRGFRAFRHLVVQKLGRINLIVGKNNVGKSCFLDALHLYAGRCSLGSKSLASPSDKPSGMAT